MNNSASTVGTNNTPAIHLSERDSVMARWQTKGTCFFQMHGPGNVQDDPSVIRTRQAYAKTVKKGKRLRPRPLR
jgi:hypothetical protein